MERGDGGGEGLKEVVVRGLSSRGGGGRPAGTAGRGEEARVCAGVDRLPCLQLQINGLKRSPFSSRRANGRIRNGRISPVGLTATQCNHLQTPQNGTHVSTFFYLVFRGKRAFEQARMCMETLFNFGRF